MNSESLKRGAALEKEIEVIERAMSQIDSQQADSDANNFWVHLSRHQDGSGVIANLISANIGKEVVDAVYVVLAAGLKKRQDEFSSL